jgi:hypothetical protein
MGMTAAVSVIGGASILGGAISAYGSESAANTAASADEQAAQLQYQEWQQQQANMQPWLTAGTAAENQLSTNVQAGKYTPPAFSFDPTQVSQNPDYQFAMNQGTNALASNAAAAGNYGSGTMGTALENYGQGAAAQYMNQYYNQGLNTYNANNQTQYLQPYNQLASLAGNGQMAANSLAQTGQAAVSNIGSDVMSAGGAQAAGTLGATNAITGGMQSGYSNMLQYSLLQNLMGGQTPPATPPATTTTTATSGGTIWT